MPTNDDLSTLEFAKDGSPFADLAVPGIETFDLSFAFDGSPFTASSSPSSFINFDEGILVTDSVTALVDGNFIDTADTLSINYQITFDEGIGVGDALLSSSGSTITPFDTVLSTLIKVGKFDSKDLSTKFGVKEYVNAIQTVNVNVQEDYLLSTTNVSSPSNIFEPTIILNGSYLVQNPSTDPGGDISKTSLYINVKNAGLTAISACDLEGYNFTLDYNGGNFSIVATQPMGVLGDIVDIYGFKGSITVNGLSLSNNQAGYTYKGIFGTPKLNRFFQYLMSANTTMLPLLTNPAFYQTQPNNWQSASSIARGIANLAGIDLQWLVFDVPVSDFRLEDNMTALDALSSMASRAGAQLRWNGNNKYIICYPDQFFGYWTPPSCSLIATDGLSNENYLDMTTGLYGINPSTLTAWSNNFQAGEKTLPDAPNKDAVAPQLQQIAKVKTKLTSDDPSLVYDLPNDYDKVYIQILVNESGNVGGTNLVDPLQNYCTRDPKQWFEFLVSAPVSVANAYVFTSNIGGAFVPQCRVDYKLFPSPNSSIDNNNFVLSIACTRKNLTPTAPVNEAQQKIAQGMAQDYFRFNKVYSGTFSVVFFGSIPVPGMWASATVPNVRVRIPNNSGGYDIRVIGDVTVEGIIESVNFNFPGFITVQVAQYKRLRYSEVPRINYGLNT